MRSEDLRPWQAARVSHVLRQTVAYLARLKRRMEQRGFPPDDRLFQLVSQAHSVMQDLTMELHYLACRSGAGRPRRNGNDSRGHASRRRPDPPQSPENPRKPR